MHQPARTAIELTASAVAGFAAFLAPLIIVPPSKLFASPLFPLVRTAVENPRVASFVGLGVVGACAGFFGRSNWMLLGLVTMGMFPLCAAAEIVKDSTSHNLLPFELIMYGVFSLAAVIGAGVGRLIRRTVTHSPAPVAP